MDAGSESRHLVIAFAHQAQKSSIPKLATATTLYTATMRINPINGHDLDVCKCSVCLGPENLKYIGEVWERAERAALGLPPKPMNKCSTEVQDPQFWKNKEEDERRAAEREKERFKKTAIEKMMDVLKGKKELEEDREAVIIEFLYGDRYP